MTGRAVWRRACPAGQALDLLHARVAEPYAPHVHEEYAVGACTAGREVIRYRGTLHYAGPGSVVVLEPGEAHTGGPADPPDFTYRVMYPAAGLLAEGLLAGSRLAQGARRMPRFREPVIADPGLAAELRRLHAALGAGLGETEPLEAESRLSWLFGELVRRHASPSRDVEVPGAGRVARLVMAQLADRLVSPPALAEIAAGTGLSRYQLIRSFRTEVGMPPYAWLAQHRVSAARALLERGCRPAEVAALTGFADQAHLTRWFRR
ncbi:MAG TPA: AraC family transcriptional regulator, partial [Streptosporangiaceae bacterium]|nr:AraC family transcriptional regulator [Streptosporangiaceae bacterium]